MLINDEIFARMDELSPAEKKVARTLLANYPAAGLGSAASLARTAGTSAPTVLRLLSRLGIGSYPEFQRRLREEVGNQLNSPFRRTERSARQRADDDHFGTAVSRRESLINSLTDTIPPSEFDRAVELISARNRQVLITGGLFSRYLAMMLTAQLDEVIPRTHFVADPLGRDLGKFLNLNKDSVLVVLDFRRYEQSAADAAEAARQRGAQMIMITDQDLSPAGDHATVVLPVRVEGVPFDSMVGALALVEVLVEAVVQRTGDRGLARMRDWENAVRITRAFKDPQ